MADITSNTWRELDADNTEPSPNGLPPGILPSELHAQGRAVMGAVKRAHSRSNVMVTSTGTGNTYAIAYTVGPTAYVKGEVFRFFAHLTNTGAATLNINALGTRALLRADGSPVAAGEIVAGQVVSVAYDGVNFLAISITGKEFKSNVSIAQNSDAILTLEDTGAPSNTFRRKMILSSRNVSGGNDWLFRQVRASDGASEDFTLRSGTGGTIWTTGNFDPNLKANLAGATFTGPVRFPGAGNNGFEVGTGDGASFTTYNTMLRSHYGLALATHDGTVNGVWDSRAGVLDVKGALKVNGQTAWHSGNFTPSLKADLNSTVRFTGSFLGSGQGYIYGDPGSHNVVLRSGTGESATPYKYAALQGDVFRTYSVDMLADGNLRATGRVVVGEGQTSSYIEMRDTDEGTRYVHNNSGNIGFLGNDAQWKLRVNDAGQVYTAQLGDLSTRIDTVATAQGNRGRDEANNNTNANFFNKTTGTQQNVNNIPSFNAAAIDIVRGGVMRARWTVDGGGTTILQNGDNGDNFFYVTTGGGVWTKQFGDLNNRIENRAADWARQESVARANERVAKTGDTMTGDLHINKAWPTLNLTWGGVRSVGWQVRDDAQTYLWDHTAGTWNMRVDTGGNIVARGSVYTGNGSANLATNGDVWGAAWGNRWLSARVNEVDGNANNRVAKTGDTMSGDLEIGKAYPNLKLHYHGVRIWDIQVREDGRLYFWGGDGQVTMSVGTGGDINTRQLGDLNNRIENRARAWAETRQANLGFTPVEQGGGPYQSGNKVRLGWDGSALRASIDGYDHERILHRSWVNPIIDVRLAYAGDLSNDWNKDQSYAEPYGGGVLTSRYVQSNQFIIDSWKGGRWRYLQKQDSYGNWYTVGYV
ncbi:UNVERIFIED_ORG: hypothetical protein M2438_002482 [Methylobacterium sp. SuP10 SLI 274]|uniref:hypothetical protein n=1 Tax=Methylorubrum extorquens TaxID=408 RepID=UPI00209CBB2A|nr:hypothetical protein [Methylorubrum extorquens]MDF9863705.1 hypothetical protein [Methylorubrum pseudosasae]MDH6637307.1 hypothetical protein [Methylobacterium sp. SuP10 SLI 274]MDH6666486.1 hypothetical protein [Methylorubrum zatmanii]MCP1558398.1 hypothetical protein [Methylorubrum extorquens]MDF9792017.1 hypothetical protein [Methylorubrum extorquens]